jgi:hypothetical protein
MTQLCKAVLTGCLPSTRRSAISNVSGVGLVLRGVCVFSEELGEVESEQQQDHSERDHKARSLFDLAV